MSETCPPHQGGNWSSGIEGWENKLVKIVPRGCAGRNPRTQLDATVQLIGDMTPDRRYASTVTALMTGFGEAVRTLGLFDGRDFEELVGQYGAIVQTQIDASTATT